MISFAWQKINKWMTTKKGSFEDIAFHNNSMGNNYAKELPNSSFRLRKRDHVRAYSSSFRLRKRDHLREYSKKFDHRCFGCLHSQPFSFYFCCRKRRQRKGFGNWGTAQNKANKYHPSGCFVFFLYYRRALFFIYLQMKYAHHSTS